MRRSAPRWAGQVLDAPVSSQSPRRLRAPSCWPAHPNSLSSRCCDDPLNPVRAPIHPRPTADPPADPPSDPPTDPPSDPATDPATRWLASRSGQHRANDLSVGADRDVECPGGVRFAAPQGSLYRSARQGALAQSARALARHARGRRFDSYTPHLSRPHLATSPLDVPLATSPLDVSLATSSLDVPLATSHLASAASSVDSARGIVCWAERSGSAHPGAWLRGSGCPVLVVQAVRPEAWRALT